MQFRRCKSQASPSTTSTTTTTPTASTTSIHLPHSDVFTVPTHSQYPPGSDSIRTSPSKLSSAINPPPTRHESLLDLTHTPCRPCDILASTPAERRTTGSPHRPFSVHLHRPRPPPPLQHPLRQRPFHHLAPRPTVPPQAHPPSTATTTDPQTGTTSVSASPTAPSPAASATTRPPPLHITVPTPHPPQPHPPQQPPTPVTTPPPTPAPPKATIRQRSTPATTTSTTTPTRSQAAPTRSQAAGPKPRPPVKPQPPAGPPPTRGVWAPPPLTSYSAHAAPSTHAAPRTRSRSPPRPNIRLTPNPQHSDDRPSGSTRDPATTSRPKGIIVATSAPQQPLNHIADLTTPTLQQTTTMPVTSMAGTLSIAFCTTYIINAISLRNATLLCSATWPGSSPMPASLQRT